ncbi:MAG: ABC transporter ATP-binding protein [Alphaproteobacteria bacterium]|nr:ABC transporter ATP-binding protein [Alphaproteobacteria bacterium]
MSVLRLTKVCKKFNSGNETINILNNISFELLEGESIALVAPSGTGKSTLLHVCATLDTPTSGVIHINNKNTSQLSDNEKSNIRSNYIGFVYQFHNLLPDFTVLENVMIPLLIQGLKKKEVIAKAKNILNRVNLYKKINSMPKYLSGGEQQRVAIARALVSNPKLILADEPTGNLDPYTASHIFELFLNIVNDLNTSLIIATHNLELAAKLQNCITINNGKLEIL